VNMKKQYNKELYTPEITGPYLNGKEAAKYCGYSYDHFRHLASQHQIPRCGPRLTRYAQSILDTWMNAPNCFKIKAFPKQKRLKKLEV